MFGSETFNTFSILLSANEFCCCCFFPPVFHHSHGGLHSGGSRSCGHPGIQTLGESTVEPFHHPDRCCLVGPGQKPSRVLSFQAEELLTKFGKVAAENIHKDYGNNSDVTGLWNATMSSVCKCAEQRQDSCHAFSLMLCNSFLSTLATLLWILQLLRLCWLSVLQPTPPSIPATVLPPHCATLQPDHR